MRYTNKRLTTDMANANGLQRAIRPTGFFNIETLAADFCSAQCIMDNTGSLNRQRAKRKAWGRGGVSPFSSFPCHPHVAPPADLDLALFRHYEACSLKLKTPNRK